MEGLYAGIDLHSRNLRLGIIDNKSKRIFEKRVNNDLALILETLKPFQDELEGIVVESTYNWYWLVDGLMDAGHKNIHLANPSAIKQYEGLKHVDDKHDAFWLAHLLSLGILPEGYIYPKKDRPVRDLLRKRAFLVRHRTSHILSLQSMIERNTGNRMKVREIKKLKSEDMGNIFQEDHLILSGEANVVNIGLLTHHIKRIEKVVKDKIKLRESFKYLLTAPGIGNILALTIMLEVGDIRRFSKVGNFSSYCRCVPSKWTSSGKTKGKGNTKNGNRYLSWAFVEAVHHAKRHNPKIKQYFQRKEAKRNTVVAVKALCNKMARACYYIMRDQVPFKEEGLFC